MSKPVQLPSGSWRIQITVNGKRIGKTFATKSECKVWAAGQLSQAVEDAGIGIRNASLWELAQAWIARYAETRAQGKRDTARLTNILKDTELGRVQLRALSRVQIASWRDERLKVVGPATVRRDWNILSSMCTAAIEDMGLVRAIADRFGSQSVLFSLDVKRSWLGGRKAWVASRRTADRRPWQELLRLAVDSGAGEIVLNAVDRDGTMEGIDEELIREACASVGVLVVAVGGVGSLEDIRRAVEAGASAVSAGAFFVFHGPHRAVLITYPRYQDLERLLAKP